MDSKEVAKLVREWFDDVSGLSPEKGFEIIDKTQFDFKEWEVKCSVFSSGLSRMVEYIVVISDDAVIAARAI